MNDCTTTGCDRSAPDNIFLCTFCIRDLQAYIELAHKYAPELNVTIAKLDVLRHAGSTGGGGGKAGSAAPVNLDAVQLQQNLYSVDRDAKVYALDQFAAGIAWTIQDWVNKAERIISGPEAEHVDHETIRAKVKDIAPAMPTRELLKWLRENAGLHLNSQQIRNWVRRGHLKASGTEDPPHYLPHEVLSAYKRKELA